MTLVQPGRDNSLTTVQEYVKRHLDLKIGPAQIVAVEKCCRNFCKTNGYVMGQKNEILGKKRDCARPTFPNWVIEQEIVQFLRRFPRF